MYYKFLQNNDIAGIKVYTDMGSSISSSVSDNEVKDYFDIKRKDIFNLISFKLLVIPISVAKKKGFLALAFAFTFKMTVNIVSFFSNFIPLKQLS